jgi:hypothetical protein
MGTADFATNINVRMSLMHTPLLEVNSLHNPWVVAFQERS